MPSKKWDGRFMSLGHPAHVCLRQWQLNWDRFADHGREVEKQWQILKVPTGENCT
jgi:hypothetical protein